jgi:hypothetical protein
MNTGKIIGYVLYAIGIVGAVEGITKVPKSIPISIIALIVIIIASYLLDKK